MEKSKSLKQARGKNRTADKQSTNSLRDGKENEEKMFSSSAQLIARQGCAKTVSLSFSILCQPSSLMARGKRAKEYEEKSLCDSFSMTIEQAMFVH